MKMKKLLSAGAIAALALFGLNANAGIIDANAARMTARNFINERVNTQGTFKSTASVADIKLAYTEASNVEGNAYYVFNVEGGGWVIVAGYDHAKQVLAYSDKGYIDMKSMPDNMKGQLNVYKEQIEAMQNYKGKDYTVKAPMRVTPIAPMLKTNWGQQEPMNRLCPMAGTERTAVGCGPLAMSQVVYYWKYPNQIQSLPGYSISWSQSVPTLPETTFDYDLILDAYTAINPSTGNPYYLPYTDEQADEVAKLCRYAGQACKARYGNSGTSTGTYTYDQRDAFKTFGYNNNIKLIGYDPSYYCDNSNKYTEQAWKELIYSELEAGHPIPYHNSDFDMGHAWVLDGVDADGKFHMNWGFFERFDGWFEFGAFGFYPYGDDEYWDFSCSNSMGNEMLINVYPYDGYVIPGTSVTPSPTISYIWANNGVTFIAEGIGEIHMYIDGEEVTSPYTMNFGATDMTVVVTATAQEEGMSTSETTERTFVLPASTFVRGDVNNDGKATISDVSDLINYLLSSTDVINLRYDVTRSAGNNINDVTTLINYLLTNQW